MAAIQKRRLRPDEQGPQLPEPVASPTSPTKFSPNVVVDKSGGVTQDGFKFTKEEWAQRVKREGGMSGDITPNIQESLDFEAAQKERAAVAKEVTDRGRIQGIVDEIMGEQAKAKQ